MGFALVIAGLLMIVTGANGTFAQFGSLIAGDFTGKNIFTYWLVGIGSVGALGYIDQFRTFSRLFMTLIIIGIFLSKKGFFPQFTAALNAGPTTPNAPADTTPNNPSDQGYLTQKPLLDAGPLGTINPQIIPGSPADTVKKWLGF